MTHGIQLALEAARTMNRDELGRLLVEIRELEVAALLRLSEPRVTTLREDAQQLLDVPEAARHIGMSVKWLYRNLAVVPSIRIGNGGRPRIRFRKRDLDAWLEQHLIRQKRG